MYTRLQRRIFMNVAGAAAVLFLSASWSPLAHSQTGRQGRGGRANNGGAGTPNPANGAVGALMNGSMGAQFGDMLNKMRQTRAFVDPGVSNTSNLLTRSDVRNELVLNGRQTETLTALQNSYPGVMMQGMITNIMSSIQKMQQDGTNLDFRAMSPDDRQQFFTQMQSKAMESMFSVQSDQDKKAEAALTPAQTKRLHELDLQWRGPLALSDEKLADKVNLTADQRTKFAVLLKELRDSRMKAQANMLTGGRMGGFPGFPGAVPPAAGGAKAPAPPGTGDTNNPNPAGGNNAPAGQDAPPNGAPAATPTPPAGRNRTAPPTQEEMQQAIDEASKQSEMLLKSMDKKGLMLLTPEQQAQWKALQGRPFTFRQYL